MHLPGTVALILFIFLASPATHACQCVPRPDVEDQYGDYSEVFLGVVTRAFPIDEDPTIGDRVPFRVMTRPVEIYKGSPPEEVSGFAMPRYYGKGDLRGGGCGPEFEIGRFYIVFRRLEFEQKDVGDELPPDDRRRYSRPRFSPCSHTVWPVSDEALEFLRRKMGNDNDA